MPEYLEEITEAGGEYCRMEQSFETGEEEVEWGDATEVRRIQMQLICQRVEYAKSLKNVI